MQPEAIAALAQASLKPPPGMCSTPGQKRITVFLRADDKGEYRWFREDGTPTLVHAPTVEQARHLAGLAWRSWEFEERDARG